MTKKSVIRCLLALLLLVYIGVAVAMANEWEAREGFRGYEIRISRPEGARDFVTAEEINRLLAEWGEGRTDRAASQVPLQRIEDRLNAVVNIESASVCRLADGRVRLDIVPMIPVARVFSPDGSSYYVNRNGKRLTASSRYRLDVPVITGTFDSVNNPAALIPLLDYINGSPEWTAITNQLMVEPGSNDIILVPLIRGHVVNLGDTSDIPDKLRRVMAMYRKVMPLKGWEFYDTISVKWAGQVVATRRVKSIPEPAIRFDQEGDVEEENINSMLVATDADTTAVKH